MKKPKLRALPPPKPLRTPAIEALRVELAKPEYDDAKGFAICIVNADDSSTSYHVTEPALSVHQLAGAVLFLLQRLTRDE